MVLIYTAVACYTLVMGYVIGFLNAQREQAFQDGDNESRQCFKNIVLINSAGILWPIFLIAMAICRRRR